MEVGGRPDQAVLDRALRALLDRHPGALVAAVNDDGLFVPVPDSIQLNGQRVLVARSALDVVRPSDRYAVITGWERTKAEGSARTSVVLAGSDSSAAAFHIFDVTAEHGVYVLVVVSADSSSRTLDEVAEMAPSPTRLAKVHKDEMAVLRSIDPSTTAMLGWEESELLGQRSLDFIHPDDHDRAIDMWMECLSHPGATVRNRLRHQHRDGRWMWLEIANENRLDEAGAGFVDCEMIDISLEMEAHESVRASEQLLRRLAGALPVGILQFDLSRRILYANARLFEIFGADEGTDESTLLACVVDPANVDHAIQQVADGFDLDVEIEIDRLDGGGRRLCTLAVRALTSETGAVIGGVGCLVDVTEAASMQAELEHRATHDALTGCVNRPTVLSVLDATLVADAGTDGGGIAVVFVDLDDFKAVNDRFGHAAGDAVLAEVASRLRGVVRDVDVVGRIGGDEFLVVCHDIDDADAAFALGARAASAIAEPMTFGVSVVTPSASVGVAWSRAGSGEDVEAIVARADRAMYATKHAADRT